MRREHAERIAAADERIELTYLPDLLPTARWSGDTVGEGGVALDDPRWTHALERAEVVFGIPGNSGEGLVDLVRRAPRLAVGAGPQRRRRRAARRRAALVRPTTLDGVTVTTSSGVHAGPLAEFAHLRPARVRQGAADAAARPARAPLARGPAPGRRAARPHAAARRPRRDRDRDRAAGERVRHARARGQAQPRQAGVPHVDELHPVSELRALVARADAHRHHAPGHRRDARPARRRHARRGQARRRARQRRPRRGGRRGRARRAPPGRHASPAPRSTSSPRSRCRRTARCGGSRT